MRPLFIQLPGVSFISLELIKISVLYSIYRILNHFCNWLGLYELWLIDHKADVSKSFLNDLSEVLKDVNETLTSSQICGALQSEFGKVNTIAVIWQHQSFDHTKDLRQTWNDKGIFNRQRAIQKTIRSYAILSYKNQSV